MSIKANIVGLIRFSWVALKRAEWRQTSGKSTDEIAALLYQKERMENRFKYFEAVCLPSISLLDHPGSRVIILVSDLMPDEYMIRLKNLTAPFPHIILHRTPPQSLERTCIEAIKSHDLHKCETIITYRLDDDDAVFSNFDSYLIRKFGHPTYHDSAVTIPMGVEVQYRDGGIYGGHRWYPGVSAGLAFVESPNNMKGIFSTGNHTSVYRRYPCLYDPRKMGWLRLKHETNDSDENFIMESELTPDYFNENLSSLFPWWRNLFLTQWIDAQTKTD